ncbi:MAG: RHS repeat-associated core domain-containing protein, partial [Paludibacteraceae bacterium]|nr:RHS repeat-associated core domain-containing protein [Paludibacteraceae bacterium]
DAAGNAAAVDHNGTYYYYLRNGQGDIVKLIDGNGATVVEYTYESWGKLLSCTGTLATTLGVLNPFRYRGYVYDEETGFYYLKSRYYDPETCRFISADVLLSTGQGVIGHNCYAYCGSTPATGVDPNGTWNWGGVLTGLGLVAAGVVLAAAAVASGGTLIPVIAAGVSACAMATGATMTYAAATDSVLVTDYSVSHQTGAGTYVKVGISNVVDYKTNSFESYSHVGGGLGASSGLSYSTGIVENYHNPGDYAGPFVDISVTNGMGVDHCFSPEKPYKDTVKATSISFTAPGFSAAVGWDNYKLCFSLR